MRKLVLLFTALCGMVLLISASPVRAQSNLWVANYGNDGNSCSQASPCATFLGAIFKGGVAQINCLTSGDYGPVLITASITIDCGTGNIGNVVVSSGSAIVISTNSAATIVLRHLSLNGLGMATNGIVTNSFSSGALIVEDCMIRGFVGGAGIQFGPNAGRGLLQVSNTQSFGNFTGMLVIPAGGQIASVTLNQVEMVGNSSTGLYLTGVGVIAGTMRDSVTAANAFGLYSNASQVYFTVEESSIVANLSVGIQTSSAGSVINVGGSTIGGNNTGVSAGAGSLISFGNNQMSANAVNGNFSSTTALR